MNINVTGERPGVYSSYSASLVTSRRSGGKTVGVVASGAGDLAPRRVSSLSEAAQSFGGDAIVMELLSLVFQNGAPSAIVVLAGENPTEQEITAAAGKLETEDCGVVICTENSLAAMKIMRDMAESAANSRRERVYITAADGTAAELCALASELQSERTVVFGPLPKTSENTVLSAAALAAALAGQIAALSDPAIPLGGGTLSGIAAKTLTLADSVVDTLVRGGVSPVETVSGRVTVVRAVTTRTRSGESEDFTWRELSTVMIADDVLSTLRSALRAKFLRAKNLSTTREAVKTQVMVELEAKKNSEIIADYGEISVNQNETEPSRCDVSFRFAVASGLNQIVIGAQIVI